MGLGLLGGCAGGGLGEHALARPVSGLVVRAGVSPRRRRSNSTLQHVGAVARRGVPEFAVRVVDVGLQSMSLTASLDPARRHRGHAIHEYQSEGHGKAHWSNHAPERARMRHHGLNSHVSAEGNLRGDGFPCDYRHPLTKWSHHICKSNAAGRMQRRWGFACEDFGCLHSARRRIPLTAEKRSRKAEGGVTTVEGAVPVAHVSDWRKAVYLFQPASPMHRH